MSNVVVVNPQDCDDFWAYATNQFFSQPNLRFLLLSLLIFATSVCPKFYNVSATLHKLFTYSRKMRNHFMLHTNFHNVAYVGKEMMKKNEILLCYIRICIMLDTLASFVGKDLLVY
jgi:hypothetical protein